MSSTPKRAVELDSAAVTSMLAQVRDIADAAAFPLVADINAALVEASRPLLDAPSIIRSTQVNVRSAFTWSGVDSAWPRFGIEAVLPKYTSPLSVGAAAATVSSLQDLVRPVWGTTDFAPAAHLGRCPCHSFARAGLRRGRAATSAAVIQARRAPLNAKSRRLTSFVVMSG